MKSTPSHVASHVASLSEPSSPDDSTDTLQTTLTPWHHSYQSVAIIPRLIGSIPKRFKLLVRRYQAHRIRKAIATYSFEKHVLNRYYRPVVSQTLMRLCTGQIEKNKFPFHVLRENEPQPVPFHLTMPSRILRPSEDTPLETNSRFEFYLPFRSEPEEEETKSHAR